MTNGASTVERLAAYDPWLGSLATSACHPEATLSTLPRLADALAFHAAASCGLAPRLDEPAGEILVRLRDRSVVGEEVALLVRVLRRWPGSETQAAVKQALRALNVLASWFTRAFPAPDAHILGPLDEHSFRARTLAFPAPAANEAARRIQAGMTAGQDLAPDEAANRLLIDLQLREAGWEADTEALRHSLGGRPMAGRNLAIAEWPTSSGPVDYALFAEERGVAVVEAKRRAVDVPAVLDQARRYARDIELPPGTALPGAPWDSHQIPFVFATNGRPYLEQLRTKSGIWHRDLRRPENPAVPLLAWKSPAGLLAELEVDAAAAHAALTTEPFSYLGLRDYQVRAIQAVEKAIAEGDREILVAMATGTGKTRTCIGLAYRLVKSGRFRRILFLVDRTALGEQAADAFGETRLEELQTFDDIYDVKRIGDVTPSAETRLQFATVQGMVKRLLYADATPPPPVDTYDCIVVDESHRGYQLDREMSDAEIGFRDQADYVSKYRRVLDWFDAVRIGLTATPALHTVEIFGDPVYTYGYREAVIDGWLADHEPPFRILTKLADKGILFVKESEAKAWESHKGQMRLFRVPDEIRFDVEDFNREVITRPFNEVVCRELVKEIDPHGDGKTLIFCADNEHADLVVDLLRGLYRERYETFEDDLVGKITGSVDKPLQKIREYRNERAPNIAVTVDLLSTGVDIPRIVNIVFLRRVSSRVLYEQMLGRATRLCPEIGKESFRVYDAVGLYDALQDWSDMKPVVANPRIAFAQLAEELLRLTDDDARALVLDQLRSKLARKTRSLKGEALARVEAAAGEPIADVVQRLKHATSAEAAAWFLAHPHLPAALDHKPETERWRLVSEHPDQHLDTVQDFPEGKTPDDYLTGFREYLAAHKNDVPALRVVMTRPRDLTRKQLRELRLALDAAGYPESALEAAWARKTNREIAASILGHIRQQALGSALVPYAERVDRALTKLLGSRAWTRPQREWLERIAAQLRREVVVDREALDSGAFRAKGGFKTINRVFDGDLDGVLGDLNDRIWEEAG